MTITVKNIERRRRSRGVRRQLATESIFALARLRQTGQTPTQAYSPLLLWLWQRARDLALVRGAKAHIYVGPVGMALRITVSALWDDQNKLSKFMVYDAGTGSLLLVGDMNGPLFSPLAVQATTKTQSPTNERLVHDIPQSPSSCAGVASERRL